MTNNKIIVLNNDTIESFLNDNVDFNVKSTALQCGDAVGIKDKDSINLVLAFDVAPEGTKLDDTFINEVDSNFGVINCKVGKYIDGDENDINSYDGECVVLPTNLKEAVSKINSLVEACNKPLQEGEIGDETQETENQPEETQTEEPANEPQNDAQEDNQADNQEDNQTEDNQEDNAQEEKSDNPLDSLPKDIERTLTLPSGKVVPVEYADGKLIAGSVKIDYDTNKDLEDNLIELYTKLEATDTSAKQESLAESVSMLEGTNKDVEDEDDDIDLDDLEDSEEEKEVEDVEIKPLEDPEEATKELVETSVLSKEQFKYRVLNDKGEVVEEDEVEGPEGTKQLFIDAFESQEGNLELNILEDDEVVYSSKDNGETSTEDNTPAEDTSTEDNEDVENEEEDKEATDDENLDEGVEDSVQEKEEEENKPLLEDSDKELFCVDFYREDSLKDDISVEDIKANYNVDVIEVDDLGMLNVCGDAESLANFIRDYLDADITVEDISAKADDKYSIIHRCENDSDEGEEENPLV